MRYILLIIAIATLALTGCKNEQTQSGDSAKESGKLKTAMKKAMKELSKEITDENFKKGKTLTSIKMLSLKSNKVVDLSSFKGKKVLIDFWSSWCVPCIEMFPDLNKIKAEYEDKQGILKVITISVDPMPGKIKEIIKDKNATFEVLQASESLQNAGILLPHTLLVDESGKIVNSTNGKHSFEELKKFIGVK